MIIFNEREYYNHFFEQNDRMLDIKSEKSLEELYQMLLHGEAIDSVAEITGTVGIKNRLSSMNPMKERTSLLANPLTDLLGFNENMPNRSEYSYFDEDDAHEEANKLVQETIKIQGTRPSIFFDKECQQFNLPLKHYDELENWSDFTREDLITEIGDALSIMPNLQKEEISFEEQKHLSIIGKDLFLPNNVIRYAEYNGLPTYEDLKYYDTLPRIQKDFLRPEYDHMSFHPLLLLHMIREKYHGLINADQINEEIRSYIYKYSAFHYSDEKITFVTEEFKEFIKEQQEEIEVVDELKDMPNLLSDTDALFKEKFRGRSPRVLDILVRGYSKVYENLTAEKIVEEFNQQNVSKVAKYKNEVLLVLSGMLNFNNIKESHIPILGSLLTTSLIKTYQRNGFLTWYKENSSKVTDAELEVFCSKAHTLENIPEDTKTKDLMNHVMNHRGYRDMLLFEEDYGYSFENNMVAIRGRNVICSDGVYKMYLLKADDIRNFTVGYDTHCCQHHGSAGSSCVMKATTEPFAGTTVIEKNGIVVGQAFVWTDELKDTFVFDNMEFANDADIALYESIIAEYVKQLPYSNVHIGTGYLAGGMAGWGNKITSQQVAQMPTLINRHHVYTDYNTRARVLKNHGKSLIFPTKAVQTTFAPEDNTNKLLQPENLWALQLRGKTTEEKLQMIDEIKDINTWNQNKQLELITSAPMLIDRIECPSDLLQTWIVDNFPEYIKYIHNPNIPTIEKKILMFPGEIDNILKENTDFILRNDFSKQLLRENPSILKKIFSLNIMLDDDTIKEIIQQDPYKIRTFPESYLTEEIKAFAVELEPKLVTLLDVSKNVLNRAANISPNISALMDEIPEDIQITMVTSNSASLNNIKHPCRQAIEIAVRDNPLLIRNYQYSCPDLIPECIQQKNSVINVIKHPTAEHFALLNGYVPTNPYIKRDFLAWQRSAYEIER